MKLLLSKDDCAPDAKGVFEQAKHYFKVDDFFFDVIFKNECYSKVSQDAGDLTTFKHKGKYYQIQQYYGKYEELFELTKEEVISHLTNTCERLTND